MNGWQTAYGYDNGALAAGLRALGGDASGATCGRAAATLTDPRERELLRELRARLRRASWRSTRSPTAALRAGDEERVRDIFLGPGDRALQRDGGDRRRARHLRAPTAPRPRERAFDDARDDARKRLIAVALGAGIVIVLLLVTASDVARMALEGERHARARSDD